MRFRLSSISFSVAICAVATLLSPLGPSKWIDQASADAGEGETLACAEALYELDAARGAYDSHSTEETRGRLAAAGANAGNVCGSGGVDEDPRVPPSPPGLPPPGLPPIPPPKISPPASPIGPGTRFPTGIGGGGKCNVLISVTVPATTQTLVMEWGDGTSKTVPFPGSTDHRMPDITTRSAGSDGTVTVELAHDYTNTWDDSPFDPIYDTDGRFGTDRAARYGLFIMRATIPETNASANGAILHRDDYFGSTGGGGGVEGGRPATTLAASSGTWW